jgi:hypothetical protein
MAWSGFRETAGDSGLELRLGLPAYFTKPVAPAGGLLCHFFLLVLHYLVMFCLVLV